MAYPGNRPPQWALDRLDECLSYDRETGILTWRKCYARRIKIGDDAGCQRPDGYVVILLSKKGEGRKQILATHAIWWITHREWPRLEIDHIDMDRSNNRLSNLRLATRSQNLMNSPARSHNKLGIKGVCRYRNGKYLAYISIDKTRHHLGYFLTADEASAAYQAAALRHHGNFARA